jgi:very-short-patch-repair endonuclease
MQACWKTSRSFSRNCSAAAKPLASKSIAEVKNSVDEIRNHLKQNERIARYVGDGFAAQLEKAVVELGGKKFLSQAARAAEERKHIRAHGHEDDHEHSVIASPGLRRSK